MIGHAIDNRMYSEGKKIMVSDVLTYLLSHHQGGGGRRQKEFKASLSYKLFCGLPGLQETLSQETPKSPHLPFI